MPFDPDDTFRVLLHANAVPYTTGVVDDEGYRDDPVVVLQLESLARWEAEGVVGEDAGALVGRAEDGFQFYVRPQLARDLARRLTDAADEANRHGLGG